MDEHAYIKEAAEESKEYQIEFLYQLAGLTDEELLQTQRPEEILREAIAKRDKFIGELKRTILQRGHLKECNDILLHIEKYFAANLPLRQVIKNQTIAHPVSDSL